MKEKINVTVDFTKDGDGEIEPRCIHWTDGRIFAIERTVHVCRSDFNDEFDGIRFTVLINGIQRFLYLLSDRWYVEAA